MWSWKAKIFRRLKHSKLWPPNRWRWLTSIGKSRDCKDLSKQQKFQNVPSEKLPNSAKALCQWTNDPYHPSTDLHIDSLNVTETLHKKLLHLLHNSWICSGNILHFLWIRLHVKQAIMQDRTPGLKQPSFVSRVPPFKQFMERKDCFIVAVGERVQNAMPQVHICLIQTKVQLAWI